MCENNSKLIGYFIWIGNIFTAILLVGCELMDDSTPEESLGSEGVSLARQSDTFLQNRLFYQTIMVELEITPNTPTPSFAWRSTGSKYMRIGIFQQKIDLDDRTIANPIDAVWTWHSGLARGREGNVSFSDGADVRNGIILGASTPLPSGDYFIALWGYNDNHDLIYSSQEYRYLVP